MSVVSQVKEVIATHADQALALLEAPDYTEQAVLGAFRSQANRVEGRRSKVAAVQ